jgi:hypothetical protein
MEKVEWIGEIPGSNLRAPVLVYCGTVCVYIYIYIYIYGRVCWRLANSSRAFGRYVVFGGYGSHLARFGRYSTNLADWGLAPTNPTTFWKVRLLGVLVQLHTATWKPMTRPRGGLSLAHVTTLHGQPRHL